MKIAISATSNNINSSIETRFGRALYFVIYDLEDDSHLIFENTKSTNMAHGAGVNTAQSIVNLNVDAVVSGRFGPNALMVLKSGNIKTYSKNSGTIIEAIEDFKNNKLEEIIQPNSKQKTWS